MNIITGRRGTNHVSSDDARMVNISAHGIDDTVFDIGNKMKATRSGNTINISDGIACIGGGTYVRIDKGTTESVQIETAASGQSRTDLICIRYVFNSSDRTESANVEVRKNMTASGIYTANKIIDGATSYTMPLYEVTVNGTSVGDPVAVFKLRKTLRDEIEELWDDVVQLADANNRYGYFEYVNTTGTNVTAYTPIYIDTTTGWKKVGDLSLAPGTYIIIGYVAAEGVSSGSTGCSCMQIMCNGKTVCQDRGIHNINSTIALNAANCININAQATVSMYVASHTSRKFLNGYIKAVKVGAGGIY